MGVAALIIPLLAVGAASTLGLGTIGTALLVGGATLASSLLGSSKGIAREDNISLKLSNTRDTITSVPIIYGTSKIGGNDVFISVQPSNPKYLWIVQTLCEGECEGIEQHGSNDLIYINDKLVHEYEDDLVQYTFHNGSNTQTVDTLLNAQFSSWTDTLRNTAYIVFRFKYDPNKFNGIPSRHVVLKGRKVFDFNTETFTFSNNPVRILYDYLTNKRYGLGISTDSFDNDAWLAISNDIQIKDWGFDYVFFQTANAKDVIELILVHFRGALIYFDGIFSVSETEFYEPTEKIRDEDIAVDADNVPIIFFNQSAKGELPDGIYVKYVIKDTNWDSVNVDTFSIGDKRGKVEQISYIGCLNKEQASDLALYTFERQRLSRVITVVLKDNNIIYAPNDIIGFVCSELGIGNAESSGEEERVVPHRIIESTILSNGQLQMVLIQEDATLYDKEFNPDPGQIYKLSFPDPSEPPPGVLNFIVTEIQYKVRERTGIKLNCTFEQPSNYPWFSHANISVGINDSSLFADYGKSTGQFSIDDVIEGTNYYIKLQSVSDYGVLEAGSLIYQHIVGGVDKDRPPSPLSLSVNRHRGSITLSTPSLINYTDIAAYEFRLGESWSTGIFVDRVLSSTLTLGDVKPSAIVNLSPSDPQKEHTFWVNTLGTNGLYGETPASADLFLNNPPIGLTPPPTAGRIPLLKYKFGDPYTMTVPGPSPWTSAIVSSAVGFAAIGIGDNIYILNGGDNVKDTFKVISKSPPVTLVTTGATQAWPAGTRYAYSELNIQFHNTSIQNIAGTRYLQCDHLYSQLSGYVQITNLPAFANSAGTFYSMYAYSVSGIGDEWRLILGSGLRVSEGTITATGGMIATLTNLDDYTTITGLVQHYSVGTLSLNVGLTEATLTVNDDWIRIPVNSNLWVGSDYLTVIGKTSPNILQITGASLQWIDLLFVYTGVIPGETYGTNLYVPYPTVVEVLAKIDSEPPVAPYDILLTTPQTLTNLPFVYDGPLIEWRDCTFSSGWTVFGGTITVTSPTTATISNQAVWDQLNNGDYIVISESLPNEGLLDIARIKIKVQFTMDLIFYSSGFNHTWTNMAFTIDSNPKKWSDLVGDSGAGFKLDINADYIDGTITTPGHQKAARLELFSETYTTAPLRLTEVTINIEDPTPSSHLRIRDDIEIQNASR